MHACMRFDEVNGWAYAAIEVYRITHAYGTYIKPHRYVYSTLSDLGPALRSCRSKRFGYRVAMVTGVFAKQRWTHCYTGDK